LSARRFFCESADCTRKIFTERLPGIIAPFARRTIRLTEAFELIGFALGGEPGARVLVGLAMLTSPDTVLRTIRRAPLPSNETPRVLGVDDWAGTRGRTYGTILVDLERRYPVDLLADRTAETLAEWLRTHPGVEVISRDRSTEYIRGITAGAPDAIQVADRWHLVKNLREALQRMLDRHPECLGDIEMPTDGGGRGPLPRSPSEEQARQAKRDRRKARYEEVRALHAQGFSMLEIGRRLSLSRWAVRHYVRADAFPEWSGRPRAPSMLEPYVAHLEERWNQGCRNGLQLWREIQSQDYPGSRKLVSRWVQQRRDEPARTTPRKYRNDAGDRFDPAQDTPSGSSQSSSPRRTTSSRRLVWLLLHEEERLTTAERHALRRMQHVCNDVETAYPLVQDFLRMIRGQKSEAFPPWLEAVATSDLADLQTFAAGLERDRSAVLAALSVPWSNGMVEGQVNRLKLIKRQMFGRGKVDLLRQRVLYRA
jgi:transposase